MKPTQALAYRPDIDGLRAIAVLAVIAFHANSDLLPGGFIGVDVFFVLSGFLITGLIYKSLEQGSFSFGDFYLRRIKRILPAYIAVALVTLGFSSWLLIPNDYIFYTTSLAASWAFASNVFFSMLSWGYFGQRTEEFPLLHTWSLSVEEQFYFIFPVILILLHRYARRWLVPLLLAIGAACLAFSQWKIGEVRSYFLLSSRAHELMIGALTWFASQRLPALRPGAALAAGTAGLGMVLASMLVIGQDTPFPGLNSLYPCLGVALLIYAGRTGTPLRAALASKPMVAVGLISYSLYLWHWPIFAFLRYRRIDLSLEVAALAVLLTFALAILTWKFIEQPIRHRRELGFRQAALRYYVLPASAFLAVGLYSYASEGMPERFSGEMRELISSYSFERDLGRLCAVREGDEREIDRQYLERHCAWGDTTRTSASLLLIGDSHAHHFKPFMQQLATAAHVRGVYHVQGGCFPTTGVLSATGAEGTTCERRNAALLALAGHYRYVALGGQWATHPSLASLEKELGIVVEKIIAAGATPIILKDNADFEPDLSQCVLHRKRGWLPADTNCHIPRAHMEKTQGPADRMIDGLQARHPKLLVIDPKQVMCDARECKTWSGNMAFYKDSNHINTRAALYLGDRYNAEIGNPLQGADGARPLHMQTHALAGQQWGRR
ncbi:acyltransferase family protein [Noviherbaspirillum aridicola]|uniref:Acyltransferase n=1 Tax=Noviherbaspirillum aridicola TaxID=2849687 RepID=A0ABQ4Q7J3_9BURK|nr:acyltransferase family protein [Noviherbaspirillum aridicola]GIZ52750.1 acyltransferase [Noviherbaspirillum aridicola]